MKPGTVGGGLKEVKPGGFGGGLKEVKPGALGGPKGGETWSFLGGA